MICSEDQKNLSVFVMSSNLWVTANLSTWQVYQPAEAEDWDKKQIFKERFKIFWVFIALLTESSYLSRAERDKAETLCPRAAELRLGLALPCELPHPDNLQLLPCSAVVLLGNC